jgi:hypothetical protein
MVKCYVIFEARTKFLNNIYNNFGFEELTRGLRRSIESDMNVRSMSKSIQCGHMKLYKTLVKLSVKYSCQCLKKKRSRNEKFKPLS